MPTIAITLQNECTEKTYLNWAAGSTRVFVFISSKARVLHLSEKSCKAPEVKTQAAILLWAWCWLHRIPNLKIQMNFESLVNLIWREVSEIIGKDCVRRGKWWGTEMWVGNKKWAGVRKKGWGRGEVAFMLHFIPKPIILRSPFMSTPHIHTHTHTGIRQSFMKKSINEKARHCWEQARQRATNKNTRDMHMNTHTRTHTYTVLIPFTRLNTGKSSRKTCKWVMNFTVPEHAGSDKTREMTFAALLCDSIHQLLTLIFPILLWFPLKDRKKK